MPKPSPPDYRTMADQSAQRLARRHNRRDLIRIVVVIRELAHIIWLALTGSSVIIARLPH